MSSKRSKNVNRYERKRKKCCLTPFVVYHFILFFSFLTVIAVSLCVYVIEKMAFAQQSLQQSVFWENNKKKYVGKKTFIGIGKSEISWQGHKEKIKWIIFKLPREFCKKRVTRICDFIDIYKGIFGGTEDQMYIM